MLHSDTITFHQISLMTRTLRNGLLLDFGLKKRGGIVAMASAPIDAA